MGANHRASCAMEGGQRADSYRRPLGGLQGHVINNWHTHTPLPSSADRLSIRRAAASVQFLAIARAVEEQEQRGVR
jgi:hypothetical protein